MGDLLAIKLRCFPKHITTVLVGYLLGPAEAGLLRLARELSSMLSKPALLIRQVIFADLTRNWNQGNQAFDVIAYRTALLGGLLGMLFVVISYFFGEYLLAALLGQQFVAAKAVLTFMLLAATLDLAASPLRSALYAMGYALKAMRLYVLSTIMYLGLFILLTKDMGLIGAGVAASVAAALPLIGMLVLIGGNRQDSHKS